MKATLFSKCFKILTISTLFLLAITIVAERFLFKPLVAGKTNSFNTKIPMLAYFDTVRLSDSGQDIKIFTSDVSNGLGVLFVFTLNDTVIDSLLVQNPNIGPPAYRIIKGSTKDYLVVTTIEESGTGYIKEIDSWYRVNQYFHTTNKAVLSYTSKLGFYGDEKETEETLARHVPQTLTDTSVEIEFITNKCDKSTNQCSSQMEKKTLPFR